MATGDGGVQIGALRPNPERATVPEASGDNDTGRRQTTMATPSHAVRSMVATT